MTNAIKEIIKTPDIGKSKIGDLSHIKVHKFKMVKQLTLLAYSIGINTITLRVIGSYQNFYKEIKRKD